MYYPFLLLLVLASAFSLAHAAFSERQKDELLFGHNKARTDKGVPELTWDDAIATYAQNYADKCQIRHSTFNGYGENLAWGPGLQPGAANKLWIDGEYGRWKCGEAIRSGANANYDHYTQIVWQGTSRVGCGVAPCPYTYSNGQTATVNFIVCNFKNPGNYVGQVPYPASKCNNITACTPDSTCALNNNLDFQDRRCGMIKCARNAATNSATTNSPSTTSANGQTTTTSANSQTTSSTNRPSTSSATSQTTSPTNGPSTTSINGPSTSATFRPSSSTSGSTNDEIPTRANSGSLVGLSIAVCVLVLFVLM